MNIVKNYFIQLDYANLEMKLLNLTLPALYKIDKNYHLARQTVQVIEQMKLRATTKSYKNSDKPIFMCD